MLLSLPGSRAGSGPKGRYHRQLRYTSVADVESWTLTSEPDIDDYNEDGTLISSFTDK